MKKFPYTRPLLAISAIFVITGCDQVKKISHTGPTMFIALGKIMCGPAKDMPVDFYGTQVEILNSGELRRRALERMRGEHPELKEIDVDIKVTQTKGSAILNVTSRGEEPKFTRLFLDSLLCEYVAFHRELAEKALSPALNRVIEEVLQREKQVKELSLNYHQAKKAGASAADIEELKDELDRSSQDYQTWKKTLERFDSTLLIDPFPVVIMERPMIAVEEQ